MKEHVRTKEVVIDNAKFLIGALTFDQVDSYLTPIKPEDWPDELERANKIRNRSIEMICDGLNNAVFASIQTPDNKLLWDIPRFRKECDVLVFKKLNEEILTFSGLTLVSESPGASASVE